ncbi:hypothetical protein S7335_4319 [Synechococcus sp. PCC 7335]|uniref:DUF3598 family protein n=1 Tax=Synechococcus sp. (strain ATCC 29403 / PCC 7335) TaxID=91464 RepID=UPI00017EB0D3|nr:DUF3598 family protein [Synechococcus sp. PCC 7335]EDX86614.1 hypothetical protein S7335_4319 [Synechococcus sp. PCC 7335]
MLSQWQCIRQNIGTWYGSFTKFSAEGELLKDTPSVLTLEETELDKTMQLVLERTPPGGTTDVTTRSFSAPGPAPYISFFESGAFTQGSAQWTAFAQFGAEMSLKVGDRRARFVIMYKSSVDGSAQLNYVVLIRETQTEDAQFTEPAMTPAQIAGSWTGRLSALSASMEPVATGLSRWNFDQSSGSYSLRCEDAFGKISADQAIEEQTRELFLTGEQASSKSVVLLTGNLDYRLILLPNGTYCLVPDAIKKAVEFRVEVGWLSGSGRRSRLIRYYDDQGVWTHSALIEDYKDE